MIKTACLAAAVTVLCATAASAQYAAPMDMGWAIQNQMNLQAYGDATAYNTGMAAYRATQMMRYYGYRGPSPYFGTPNYGGSNRAAQEYIASQWGNSQRRDLAIEGVSRAYRY